MSGTTATRFRTMTNIVVAGAFTAMVALGPAVPANAQGPNRSI
ncbi:MAG: hypothetical protein ACXWD3_17800 [Mycobacterium sp.]